MIVLFMFFFLSAAVDTFYVMINYFLESILRIVHIHLVHSQSVGAFLIVANRVVFKAMHGNAKDLARIKQCCDVLSGLSLFVVLKRNDNAVNGTMVFNSAEACFQSRLMILWTSRYS